MEIVLQIYVSSVAHNGDVVGYRRNIDLQYNLNRSVCNTSQTVIISNLMLTVIYVTLKTLSAMKRKGVKSRVTTVALGSYSLDKTATQEEFICYKGFINTGYAFNRTIFLKMQEHKDLFDKTDNDW
jgi:hypothetical protein